MKPYLTYLQTRQKSKILHPYVTSNPWRALEPKERQPPSNLEMKKGYITMEDIKENTASTIQKMLCEENMSLEIPSELVESITERQDGEHKKTMNNVAKEFDSKLNKVRKLSAKSLSR